MDALRYYLAVLLVVGYPPVIVGWLLVHSLVGFWRRLGPALTLSVVGLFCSALMVALYRSRSVLLGDDLGFSPPLALLAVALFVASVLLEGDRRKHLTPRIMAGIPELASNGGGRLLDQGVYGRIRHPRYVGAVFALGALALVADWTGPYWVVGLGTLALHGVVLLEERELVQRFGEEYRSYAERVPRYLPRIRGSNRD